VEGVSKIKQNGLKAQKAHSPRQRPWVYGLIKAKRPVGAKALIINAFAPTGRIGICDTFTQGGALGYVLLPLRGVLL